VVAGVRRFQERHGLEPDGVIGAATDRSLGVSPFERVDQIRVAMERLRWLPARPSARFIAVNIPEFRLQAFDGEDGPRVSIPVVVGSALRRTKTPIMQAAMQYVIFRPIWHVPPTIARKEILPRLARDPEYLARENMEVVRGHIRQRPGPDNALGLVKFMLPNAHDVYLHDTPQKALFQRSRRDFSHGCIRVGDAVALAEFVLAANDGTWDRERILSAMNGNRNNRRIDLRDPIPVYILYTTVGLDDDGRLVFFEDIYGHDAALAQVLAKGYPYRRVRREVG
jgi:murein L,D-transpeptidase YcbB/YkuD